MANDVYRVCPAIGIARVGTSDAYYLGPETAGGMPIWPDGTPGTDDTIYRAPDGTMRRQAARFCIYRYRENGDVEEITQDHPDVEKIEWEVHVANKKPTWYTFEPNPADRDYAPNHPVRNPHVTDPEMRRKRIIDPGPRRIAGKGESGPDYHFDAEAARKLGYPATFPAELHPCSIHTLGEVRTDDAGRAVVLGGYGNAGSSAQNPTIEHFANNDDWWDDTSDGPVRAYVTLKGKSDPITVEPGWVLVTPPAYAPQIPNLVTLYDTILDVAVRRMGARPEIFRDATWQSGPPDKGGYCPDYETEIRPILERGELYPWVTAIPPKAHRFPHERLGNPDPAYNGLRQYILDVMRPPDSENTMIAGRNGQTMMPYLAGDGALGPADTTRAKYLRLTDTQYFLLQQWAAGHFTNDGDKHAADPGSALTRAVLVNCVGGAFSPGIEMTWVSRLPEIYAAPFRLKAQTPAPGPPLSLGLDTEKGLQPGDVTRYMAVPWQADFNECSAQPVEDRHLWWWPPQRPEFVYLPDRGATDDPAQMQYTGTQVAWVGIDYDQTAPDFISFPDDMSMVKHWAELGFVHNVGTRDEPVFVEVQRTLERHRKGDGGSGAS